MYQLKKYLILIFIVLISISSCKKTTTIKKWNQITIDNTICKNKIYKELDKENEISQPFKLTDTTSKKTSDVSYFTGEKLDFKNKFAKFNYCDAGYSFSDTLNIKISHQSEFSGYGFTIKLIKNKFYTEAYSFTDNDFIHESEVLPTHQLIYQKLILDKTNYKVGDSIFGYIEFKSVETESNDSQIQNFGKGYFRAKIKRF